MDTDNSRFVRQEELVPQERLKIVKATVIGVGAIGRQVSLQLAAIGCPRIQLIDFDVVDPTNVTTQGYLSSDIGEPKVFSTAEAIRQIDPSIEVETVQDRFRPKLGIGHAVFCCVDSDHGSRGDLACGAGRRCRFWTDGRMLGEVHCACSPSTILLAGSIIRRHSLPKRRPRLAAARRGARSTPRASLPD